MLGVKTYTRDYYQACRDRIRHDVTEYRRVASLAGEGIGSFSTTFFHNLVIVLDAMFVHRLRTVEGKDGNPMNEVRIIVNSLLYDGGALTPEKSIKYAAAKSVLKLEPGATISLSEEQFVALADAFFEALEAKFVE